METTIYSASSKTDALRHLRGLRDILNWDGREYAAECGIKGARWVLRRDAAASCGVAEIIDRCGSGDRYWVESTHDGKFAVHHDI